MKAGRDQLALDIPPGLKTMGELGLWLDAQPASRLLSYVLFGAGEAERLACLNSLIRRELRHVLRHHPETVA